MRPEKQGIYISQPNAPLKKLLFIAKKSLLISQLILVLHTKQSCSHDGQIRDPWKRESDPMISKINCEVNQETVTSITVI